MPGLFERTTPDYDNTHTIHKAGCGHLRRVRAVGQSVIPVDADTIEGAIDEAAYDDRRSGFEPEVLVMPCARTVQ